MESNILNVHSSSKINWIKININLEWNVNIDLVRGEKGKYICKSLLPCFCYKYYCSCILYNFNGNMLKNILISVQSCVDMEYKFHQNNFKSRVLDLSLFFKKLPLNSTYNNHTYQLHCFTIYLWI